MSKETRDYLDSKGGPDGAPLQKIDYTMKDTYFINTSTLLTEQSIFDKSVKHKMYKRGGFPMGSQAFTITHIRIVPYVAFTPTNVLQLNNYVAHLLEDSWLEFVMEGKEVLTYPMHRGCEISPIPYLAPIPAATNAYSIVRPKFNTYDKLSDELTIGANKDMQVSFKPAGGLTTAATSATQNWLWPNADSGFTTDIGFAIMFYLRGRLERENY